MASLTLSQVAGGGGVFRTESFSFGNVISSGVTGDLIRFLFLFQHRLFYQNQFQ